MKTLPALTLIALAGSTLAFAQGDTLDMRGADRSGTFAEAGKPTRGMTQQRVAAEYGEPASRQSPVGDPPITRWDYADFAVFFEYDKVIHAVSK